MSAPIDMRGKRFGSVTVLSRIGNAKSRDIIWSYQCDCGNSHQATGYAIRSGKTKSCPECTKWRVAEASIKHGMTDSPEFRTWTDIQTRCHNPNSTAYKDYGGRGIRVCSEWRSSFKSFLFFMGPKPSGSHSIERIDNEKGYEPGNCRWATSLEQGRNKRNNRRITINGETKTLSQWALESGVSASAILLRLKRGIGGPDLLAAPWLGPRKNNVTGALTYNGITDTMAVWSRRTGIKYSTLAMRLTKYKWTLERALSEGEKSCA